MTTSTAPSSSTGALAAPHVLATQAGIRAYHDGGSAIDAAVAAAAVLTVVYPHNVALGGDLIALVRTPDGAVRCVNASGWAANDVDPAELRSRHGRSLPGRGVDTVTVPGGVRGWEALRRFGARLPWDLTLQAALFHNRGTCFSLDDASANVIASRKRPAHTLMPAMTTQRGELRHVLSTMGGQGQPQIIAQLLLRAVAGEGAESVVAAPRAIVGYQSDGNTADTVSAEADIFATARDSLGRSGLSVVDVPPHTEAPGQANVVFAGSDGSKTAASDPRSDGAAIVAHYPRHHGLR